ncbi:MAG TPA: energy transducer TonB [Candidatus Acidoferrales bacterium]|nr:energy transducer TonB [Candidatus Acidoferrales bacterium]
MEQSKLTLPGSPPFHLVANTLGAANAASRYAANIEEWWVSPEKWRRTIKSDDFSQTIIVNGGKISERDRGDYYPLWLSNIVTALFDPLPSVDELEFKNAEPPRAGVFWIELGVSCSRIVSKVGIPPDVNDQFSVICFQGQRGLLKYVGMSGYDAEFKEYRDFKGKQVAGLVATFHEPGDTIDTEIETRITALTDLVKVDESLFTVEQPTPLSSRINSISIDQEHLMKLSSSTPDVKWPPARTGKTSGLLSLYISVDRNGGVREVLPQNSDNATLNDPATEQVRTWKFKPMLVEGSRVQVESILTFAFHTRIENPYVTLSDADARTRATRMVEPRFPRWILPTGTLFPRFVPAGTLVPLQVSVDAKGKVSGYTVTGANNATMSYLFSIAGNAVSQWQFQPYVRNGKPEPFFADIIFRVK